MATPVGHKILLSNFTCIRACRLIHFVDNARYKSSEGSTLLRRTHQQGHRKRFTCLTRVRFAPSTLPQWSKTEPKPQLLEAAGLIPCTPISIFAHCALLRRKKPATTSLGVRYRSNNRGGWKWETDLPLIRSRRVISKKFFEKRAITLNVTKGGIYS